MVIGWMAALVGSQSDVSPREQSVALYCGLGMIAVGIIALLPTCYIRILRIRYAVVGLLLFQVVLFVVIVNMGP